MCGRLLCQCIAPLFRPVVTNLLQLSKATRQTRGLRGLQTKDNVKASAQVAVPGFQITKAVVN